MDENRGPDLKVLIVVLTVISAIVVLLRLYTRCFVQRGLGWDDAMMVVGLTCNSVYAASNIVDITYGYGRHRQYLTDHEKLQTGKWGFMSGVLYNLTIFFVKFSIVLFLLRIGKLKRWVRLVIYIDFFLVFGSLATAIIVQLVQCKPITHNWDPAVSGSCLPKRTLVLVSYISSAVTSMTDFVCAVLPFFILWDLKISRRAKIIVWSLLCLGIFAGICSVVKIFYLASLKANDGTWSAIPLSIWGVAEINSGIVAASIPPTRPLFLRIVTWLRGGPKRPSSSYESRNKPYRYRIRSNDGDGDGDGPSWFRMQEQLDGTNPGGITKTTDIDVSETIEAETEGRSEPAPGSSEGLVNSTAEMKNPHVKSVYGNV